MFHALCSRSGKRIFYASTHALRHMPVHNLGNAIVQEEDDTIIEGHYVRDTEKPEARKKSDSFSRARAVSTASIDSNRHGSISNRPITRGDSIAEEAEPTEIEPPLEVSTT